MVDECNGIRLHRARQEVGAPKILWVQFDSPYAAAFIASKGLLPEYDAWCERGKLPADTVGRLVAVARAVGQQMNDGEVPVSAEVEDAMCALADVAPGVLDQSDG